MKKTENGLRYRQCPECGYWEPDLLDKRTFDAWSGWEMTRSTAPTMQATWNLSHDTV